MAKKTYYSIKNVLSTMAQYIMLLGQRANGKSYQGKETVLKEAYDNKRKFIYLRRWLADIKTRAVEAYFGDMPIKKITKGEYDRVVAWNGYLYFASVDEEGNVKKGMEIGRYCALNEYERYKSQTFINYAYILYEEFITDATYLNDEPRLLQQFVSTVARNEAITVILIGNTLSRVCPYFSEWCLDGVLKQKIGTIDVYHHHVGDTIVDIAVEYCANANAENKMFFGQSAKQIISGEWDTKDVPKLPKPKEYYDKVYEVLVSYQKFKFVIELLIDPKLGGAICYIYPFTGKRKIMRILSDTFSDSPFISSRLDTSKRAEYLISECFRLNKVCYSDNLTGSDFKNVNNTFKIGSLL